jgi:hypothetical protein
MLVLFLKEPSPLVDPSASAFDTNAKIFADLP